MKKYIFIALLGLFSLQANAQRLAHVLSSLPPLPETGSVFIHAHEDMITRQFHFDVAKPDTLSVDRIQLVGTNGRALSLATDYWEDPDREKYVSRDFGVSFKRLDITNGLFLVLYNGEQVVGRYQLQQRLPYGHDYMDFFGKIAENKKGSN